jgi:hypothetical protein
MRLNDGIIPSSEHDRRRGDPQVVGNVTQVRVRHRLALVAAIRSGSKKRISEPVEKSNHFQGG